MSGFPYRFTPVMPVMAVLFVALQVATPAAALEKCRTGGSDVSQQRFDNWFVDVDELDRNWSNVFMNPELPVHKREFCAQRRSNSVSDLIRNRPFSNSLAFQNPPGSFNTGLCWMHSRFQRAATYLANFRPDRPRPSREGARRIIEKIARRESVVEVPGFTDLREFSAAYRNEFTTVLDRMGVDCALDPTDCAGRIGDSYAGNSQELRRTMDTLRRRMLLQPGEIQFMRLRRETDRESAVSEFISHSWLILSLDPINANSMEPAARKSAVPAPPDDLGRPRDQGYLLRVVDPNFPNEVVTVTYRFGDPSIQYAGLLENHRIVPHLHDRYAGDIPSMNSSIAAYCRARERS